MNNTPGNNTPDNNTPGNNTPGNNTPGNNTPGNNTPGNNTPGNNTPDNNTPGNNPNPDIECAPVVQRIEGNAGCRMSIVGPTNCSEVSFSEGVVEFAWTTDTTFCEGPHQFLMAGHPSSTWEADNGFLLSLTSSNGFIELGNNGSSYSMTRNIGGVVRLVRADLQGISTTTGQYHWMVAGFYSVDNGGSVTGTSTFTIRE